jgi:hypothetical protein
MQCTLHSCIKLQREQGEGGHTALVGVPDPEEVLPLHPGLVGGGDDGESGASGHLVPPHHLPARPDIHHRRLETFPPSSIVNLKLKLL